MIHLDTGFLIHALVRGSAQDRLLQGWLAEVEPLAMSAVAWAEFLCGPLGAPDVDVAVQVVGERLAFGPDDATLAAQLFNQSGRRRGSLIDCMVAATALRGDATLATTNPTDFRRFEPAGLRVVVG